MILFKEDWDRYPSAIRDYKTNNKSFLEYSQLLRLMGVQNYDFCLSLLQPELAGINIYDPTQLTDEIKDMVHTEVQYNPWYYLREVCRIPPIASLDSVPFKANRANISLFWTFFNNIDYFLIQPRQTGKSVSTDSLSQGLYLFWMRNARHYLITKDNTIRVENVVRLQKMRGYLPEWLVVKDPSDAQNQTMLTYNTYGNRYLTAVGQNSEDDAYKVGRGASVPYLHDDEGPFTSFIDKTLPAAMTAMNTARDEARREGYPNGAIFTTTAGKRDTREGKFMFEFMNDSTDWSERFLDLQNRDKLQEAVRNAARGRKLMILGIWNHRQLGYTDEWLYGKMVETRSVGEDADRDYFNLWTSGGISSPLPTAVLEKMLRSEIEPTWQEIDPTYGYIIRWYTDEATHHSRMASGHFVMGLDTSDAIGNDDCALAIIDITTLAPVGIATVNKTNLIRASQFVASLLVKYDNITFIPEKKSSAQTFIDQCCIELPVHGIDPFRRIFNRIVDEREKYPDLFSTISRPLNRRDSRVLNEYRDRFGFNTGEKTRELLYGRVLRTAAKRTASQIKDRKLSGQIRGLVTKNGRVDHADGGHDDIVIAWLLAQWLVMFGRNLEFYGIDPRKVMSLVLDQDLIAEDAQRKVLLRQEALREEAEELADELSVCKDPHTKILLEHRLNQAKNRLMEHGGDPETIDAVIRDAKERRQQHVKGDSRSRTPNFVGVGVYRGVQLF